MCGRVELCLGGVCGALSERCVCGARSGQRVTAAEKLSFLDTYNAAVSMDVRMCVDD